MYVQCLPSQLFRPVYSTVLEDRNGALLGATIAEDGQWRFPARDSVPHKFASAIVAFEDQHFYQHPGVDPLALGRAMVQNIRNRRIVSGGSTLTMQVIRLSRRRNRTLPEKFIEMAMATRLELRHSKEEVLAMYAAHAPFGGNVVGLEAAAWRYYGRSPWQLSWAEAAALAVLPNAPSLVFPGRNEAILRDKRDRLLDRLFEQGAMDSLGWVLAKEEPLPGVPLPLPQLAPSLLTRCIQEGMGGQRVVTTLDAHLQAQAKALVNVHAESLRGNQVYNAAALILDVRTGEALAYVGNVDMEDAHLHGGKVDVITAPRSTGSILKPMLYAGMLHEGSILPNMLVPDVPTVLKGFAPQNFNYEYDGAVPASRALARSLNVPMVHMLRDYNIPKFHQLLNQIGLTTITRDPGHYGLSLILGGAEGSLWDISGTYASMSRSLVNYFNYPEPLRYAPADWHAPEFLLPVSDEVPLLDRPRRDEAVLEAGSLYLTFQAMLEVYRPDERANWQRYSSARRIAWKTGTSYGFRDAWAVGVTPEYVVGVWAGNASGEGRPGLVGISAAGPLLFNLFDLLPPTTWFEEPRSDLVTIETCAESGFRLGPNCPNTLEIAVPPTGVRAETCPYHHRVHLDASRKYRVHSDCESVSTMVHEDWFVLPPAMEYYYKGKNDAYQTLPPWRADCQAQVQQDQQPMELMYPAENATIYIPRELDGSAGRAIFEAAHRQLQAEIHWHLDDVYLGSTSSPHSMEVYPEEGYHTLTLVDEEGALLTTRFEVVGRKN